MNSFGQVSCVSSLLCLFLLLILGADAFDLRNDIKNNDIGTEESGTAAKTIADNKAPSPSPSPAELAAEKVIPQRGLVTDSDDYVVQNKKRCLETRSLVSCMKYKASRIVWQLATNSLGYFPNEFGRQLSEDNRRFRFIQLGEPTDIVLFTDARSYQDDSEFTKIIKFFKRAAEVFGRNHGFQLQLSSESGARISDGESQGRLDRKKRRWMIILPLIILMKIAHLKMTLVPMLLGVLGLNVLLLGGTGWIIHYLKLKTLCKIHPHLVQSHAHLYDPDPSEYSTFLGSSSSSSNSFAAAPYYNAGPGPHEVSVNSYAKDWSTSKAYNGYNYLDTISKRLQ